MPPILIKVFEKPINIATSKVFYYTTIIYLFLQLFLAIVFILTKKTGEPVLSYMLAAMAAAILSAPCFRYRARSFSLSRKNISTRMAGAFVYFTT